MAGIARLLARAVLGLSLVVGCSSASDTDVDVAGAYAVVIEWIAARSPSDSDPPVALVVAQGEGFDIDLSLQAAIVNDVEDEVDVRFLDDRSEAFDDGTVREEGVLIGLGPALTDGAEILIDGDETTSVDDVTAWEFRLRPEDGGWTFAEPPVNTSE